MSSGKTSKPLVGLFVGGASRRMGRPKGLMKGPSGERLVTRVLTLLEPLGVDVVLVGRRREYEALSLPVVADAPSGIGPMGGLAAVLRHAQSREVIALACDMPYFLGEDVCRLLRFPSQAPIVAPKREGRWEPFFARYTSSVVLPLVAQQVHMKNYRLQALFDALHVDEMPMVDARLNDWDSPQDVPSAFQALNLGPVEES